MRRFSLASVLLVAVLAVFGTSTTSRAVFLHNFNCAYCHLPGTTYATLTADNVCLQCHKPTPPNVTFADGIARSSGAGFVLGDASNAMKSRPTSIVGGAQTSHLWASGNNTVPAAGATAPNTIFYKSNYNTSTGKMTCSICHNPHADSDPTKRNVDSLRPVAVQPAGTNVANQACLACHGSWNAATTHGRGTHPINIAYPGVNATDGYVDSAPSDAKLTLVDGKITCVTCHGTHFTDSDATTPDGPGLALTASTRGVLLKGNGPEREVATGSGICTSCHEYGAHGSATTKLGCMVCHGGHNASDGADPNIFMLNRTITLPDNPSTPAVGDPVTVTLVYTDPAYVTATPVGFAGICAACHTSASLPVGHNPLSDCTICHKHNGTTGSFAASCSSCHGYPPVDDTAKGPSGYAVDPNAGAGFLKGYKYLDDGTTLRAVYKNETNTPHKAHAAGGGDYTFGCAQCHSAQSWLNLATHVNNNFQDVAFTGQLAVTGGLGATYNGTVTLGNDGVCSNIYCHSNGGKRTGDGTRTYTAAAVPAWENGSVAGAITTCDACHDNSGTMARDSAAHAAHIAKGYTCNLCHKDTAASNTVLAAGAIGGKHVDGNHDVGFNTAYPLGAANLTVGAYVDATAGTCATYCHSNGTTQVAADWDNTGASGSGACGACHQVSVGGVATGSGPALGGAHNAHVFDATGPKLVCTVCHSNNGTGADHVNGAKSFVAGLQTVCNTCHGATIGQTTGNDREPVWTLATSVDCSTCHVGTLAVINTRTAPAKNNFAVEGHGDPALTAAPACTGCHALTTAHLDGATNSNMLTGGATANDAFCKSCHTTPAVQSHYATTGASATGDACALCHEAHGDGMGTNTDAMLIVGAGFTNRTLRGSYWNSAKNGVCQVCHDAGIVSYYNRTVDPAIAEAGHNPGKVCTECHKHDSTPAFKAGCTDCHGTTITGNYWPDSGVEHGTAWPNRLGSHDLHVTKIAKVKYATASPTVTQKNATCDYCHVGGGHSGDQAAAPADLGGFKNILGAANVRTASTSQVGTDVTCSNVDCHYTTPPVATDWYTAGDQALANCNYCHVYTGTYVQGTLPNAHDKHMGETADNGRNMDCLNCHLSPGIDAAHQNGVIDFSTAAAPLEATLSIDVATTAGSKLGPKYGAAGAVATEFSSCANLACHGNFSGGTAANAPNWFNTDAQKGVGLGDGRCGTCHGSDSAATPTSNKHAVHLGDSTYVPGDCNDCHTKTAATHVYGSVNLGGNATVASVPSCTNACHTLDGLDNNAAATADNPSWTSANKLGCEDCHVSGKTWAGAGGALLTRGLPPTSGKHGVHVGGYFAAGCVDCHASNAVTHSVLDNNVAVSGNKVSVYGAGTCTNTCHTLNGVDNALGGGNDATWTSANLLGCVDCHSNAKTGLKANLAPTSGLHATVNAMAHDVQFKATAAEAAPGTATCTSCHSGTVTSQHIDTVGPTAFGVGGITYTWNANINTYGAAGCAAKCHLDAAVNGGNGKWSRKWLGVTDAKPLATDDPGAAVCDNCHGDGVTAGTTTVDNVWNTGLVPAHLDSPDADTTVEMLAQHGNCKTCHGYGDAAYGKTWGTLHGHGDGMIEMNGPAGTGAGYDGAQYGCLAACHTGSLTVVSDPNYNHTLADSGWTLSYGNYGSGDCATCHASAGRNHSGLTESQATHDLHTGSELGIGACTQCHPHDGVSVPPGTGIHAVGGTVNFANKIPNTYDYNTADFGGNCATNTCHDTDGTTEWKAVSLGADACADCHNSGKTGAFTGLSAYPPSSNKHALHNGNTAVIADCSECHGHNGTLSSVAPYSNHVDGSLVVGGQLSAYANPSCTNSCHALAGNGGGAVTWTGATQLGCADCHNKAGNTIAAPIYATLSASVGPTGDKHAAHTTADPDYVADCAACHNHNGTLGSFATTGHVNGVQKTLVASITVNADKSCTNSCHLAASANEWISGSLVCVDCHTTAKTLGAGGDATMSGTVAPNTNKHALHMLKTNYVTGCTTCHSHSGALGSSVTTGHVNGPTKADIGVANQITVSPIAADKTCTNNCHVTAPTRNWVSGTLLCADCHASLKMGDMGTGNHAIHTSGVFPAAYDTAGRGASTTDYRFYCSNCHGTTLTNHMNGVKNTIGVGYAGAGGTCNATYCHSDGNGNNKTTPNWVGGTFAGDRCDECHGNSPTTSAHTAHAVGIHAADIYSGTTGLLTTATATKAHGDAATSTTINCNICHSATVTMARNKLGTLCVSCHTGDASNATNLMAVADTSKHVDNSKQVVFANVLITGGFKSKAQLRDDIATVPSLTSSWSRSGAYKAAAGYDGAKAAAPQFLGGKCSAVDCHNGIEATWQTPLNDCMACHTELPK